MLPRWNYVLDGMVKKGWLSRVGARAGMKFPMPNGRHGIRAACPGSGVTLVSAIKDYLDHQQDHRRATPSKPAATASPPPCRRASRTPS
ncbi:hypothetical protein ACRAWF_44645 [Streptomyces sp. L7]